MEFVVEDDVLLYYAPSAVGLDNPTAGVQMSWTGYLGASANGIRMRRFYKEEEECTRIEGCMAFDYRLTAPDLGYYMSNVVKQS